MELGLQELMMTMMAVDLAVNFSGLTDRWIISGKVEDRCCCWAMKCCKRTWQNFVHRFTLGMAH